MPCASSLVNEEELEVVDEDFGEEVTPPPNDNLRLVIDRLAVRCWQWGEKMGVEWQWCWSSAVVMVDMLKEENVV